MKAAVVTGPGMTPVYGEFQDPDHGEGTELVLVSASALTNVTRARAAGSHYSAPGSFPLVPGVDGVGTTKSGQRVLFLLPEAPFGAMAERAPVRAQLCVPVPDGIDDVTAAAVINPGMSSVAALRERAGLQAGETVLVNGATGTAGQLAVQIARQLGAARVIAAGRDARTLRRLESLGADTTISLLAGQEQLQDALAREFTAGDGVDVVLDYLYGAPAQTVLAAIAASYKGAKPIRYVLAGGATGQPLTLPPAALAPVPLVLMGSGIGAIPFRQFVRAAADAVAIAAASGLHIDCTPVPLHEVETAWNADYGRSRVVFTVRT